MGRNEKGRNEKQTNLLRFCLSFGWQGGTIYQVSEELRKRGLSETLTEPSNLIAMNSNAVDVLIALAKNKGGN